MKHSDLMMEKQVHLKYTWINHVDTKTNLEAKEKNAKELLLMDLLFKLF